MNNKNITGKVLAEDFPEYIEESFKGTGLFDFEVKPLVFRLHGLQPKRDDKVMIRRAGSGEIILAGFIDEIIDEQGGISEVTVFPDALKLKDTVVGEEVDTGNAEKVKEFDTKKHLCLVEIVQKVLGEVKARTGFGFYADGTTIPAAEVGDKKKYFGNILRKLARQGIIAGLIDLVFPTDRGFHFRVKSKSELYLIEQDAHFDFKTFWAGGSWLNWSIEIPPIKIDLVVTSIKKGSWIKFHFRIPPFDLKFPTVGGLYYVYRCRGGGLEYVRTHGFYPLPPFFDLPPNLEDKYGKRVNKNTSNNISLAKVKAYLSEEGYDPDSVEVKGAIDYDEWNTYLICLARKKYGDLRLFRQDLALSFETPFDSMYWLTYRNATALEILHDLAVLSNRYLYIDRGNRLYLIPRGDGIRTVRLERRKVLEFSQTIQKAEDSMVDIQRYEVDGEGRVNTYGARVRKNEWLAVENFYKEMLQGKRVESRFKMINAGDVRLADQVEYGGRVCGVVIEIKRGMREPITEIVAERIE